MLRRSLSAVGRLIALALFGIVAFLMIPFALLGVVLMYALVIALGLTSLVGLTGGLICLLVADYRTGLMLLGAGAGAWVGNMLILDRIFAARSGEISDAIPSSSLRIDFDR